MKKQFLFFSLLILVFVSACGTLSRQAIKQCSAPLSPGESSLILIPGYGPESERSMEFIQNSIGGIIIKPANEFLINKAAADLFRQLSLLKTKEVDFVAYSWGGIIAQKFTENYGHKIQVRKVILIGTPSGGYWMMPEFLKKKLKSKNNNGNPRIFIIAGDKTTKRWYLRSPNDGKVDLSSVFAVSTAEDSKIFHLNHEELVNSELVVNQVLEWLDLP